MAFVGPAGSIDQNAALNTALQNIQLKREMERNTYFTRMTTDMSLYKGKVDEAAPNVVIKMTDNVSAGHDTVHVPFLRQLTGEPLYGDMQTRGNEEKQLLRYFKVQINKIKKAAMTEGEMSNFRVKRLQMKKMLRPQLAQYLATEMDYEHMRALCRGYSNNIMAASGDGGLDATARTCISHPNMLVAGLTGTYSDATYTGMVKWDATPATYETNVAYAIGDLPTTGAGDFSLKLLDGILPLLPQFKINPLRINGKDMYVALLNTNQWAQVQGSGGGWQNLLEKIDHRGQNSAIFTGAKYTYKGKFIIHVSDNVPGVSSNDVAPTYGLASHAVDTFTAKCGFILGDGALAYGVGRDIRYADEAIDYNSFTGLEASLIGGVARVDWNSDDGSTFATRNGKNVSSMMFVTYSPISAFSAT